METHSTMRTYTARSKGRNVGSDKLVTELRMERLKMARLLRVEAPSSMAPLKTAVRKVAL